MLEIFIVLTWLRLVHPELPTLVKRQYGTELRSKTLSSIKPDISQALGSLLEEIHTSQESKDMLGHVSAFHFVNRLGDVTSSGNNISFDTSQPKFVKIRFNSRDDVSQKQNQTVTQTQMILKLSQAKKVGLIELVKAVVPLYISYHLLTKCLCPLLLLNNISLQCVHMHPNIMYQHNSSKI